MVEHSPKFLASEEKATANTTWDGSETRSAWLRGRTEQVTASSASSVRQLYVICFLEHVSSNMEVKQTDNGSAVLTT